MKSSSLTQNRPYRVWLFRLVAIVLFCLLGGVSIAHFIVHVCAKQHPAPPAKRPVQTLYRIHLTF
ncbi:MULTISPECIES: hypothetical protein [Spirosoma]|uniref:Uncharacterized protein n=1 Tax=Spirosoma endophyticum TaxID=662367 RepID=A0A1I2B958_9BACT|nr:MULTISPECIES: hypothetical protein [Spirosoma]SFE52742.1 hypothetical protein SAMN05216167_11531 [Spirosoma endophyticum]